jgi:uncharacterized protein (DUF427 family)
MLVTRATASTHFGPTATCASSSTANLLADTTRPAALFETGLPVRWYVPRDDVRMEALVASALATRCPYKGRTEFFGVRVGGTLHPDLAWSYSDPIAECPAIKASCASSTSTSTWSSTASASRDRSRRGRYRRPADWSCLEAGPGAWTVRSSALASTSMQHSHFARLMESARRSDSRVPKGRRDAGVTEAAGPFVVAHPTALGARRNDTTQPGVRPVAPASARLTLIRRRVRERSDQLPDQRGRRSTTGRCAGRVNRMASVTVSVTERRRPWRSRRIASGRHRTVADPRWPGARS